MKQPGRPSTASTSARWPEIRARPFDRDKDPPGQIENLLSRKQQSKLRSISTVLDYRRNNNTIFSEGEDAHFVYSVVTGMVRISRQSQNGRRQVLAFMLPGDLFGIPDTGIYVNSAETVSATTLYRVPWQELRKLMLQEPEMQVRFLMRVAFDLRQAQRRIMILGQHNITQRLASFLLDLTLYPEFYDARSRQLTLLLTRFDLGDYLGTAPETVARAFAKLEKAGLVRRLSSRLVEMRNLAALRNAVGARRRSQTR